MRASVQACKRASVQACKRAGHLHYDDILFVSLLDGLARQILQLLFAQVQLDEGFLRDLGRKWK